MFCVVSNPGHAVACRSLVVRASRLADLSSILSASSLTPSLIASSYPLVLPQIGVTAFQVPYYCPLNTYSS